MSRVFALLWYLLGAALVSVTLVCVLLGYTNYVLFFPSYLGVCCFVLPFIATAIRRRRKKGYAVARAIFLTLFFAFDLYFCAVMGVMAVHARTDAPSGCDLLILGSGLDNGRPDTMLQARLDTALVYLQKNPASNVVCCGGSTGRQISEAEAMRRFLLANGIDDSRILLDEASTSTEENISFAAAFTREGHDIAICSSEFHLYRAKEFAKKAGLGEVYGVAAPTPAAITPGYWFREFFGISRMWILGY